jgi:hypothetical protein
MERKSKFDNVDRAFIQRMLATSALKESDAEDLLAQVTQQFAPNGRDRELSKTIKKINKSLKPLSGLEIVKRSNDAHGDVYYGVVNTDGDGVAEKYGSSFEPWELEALRKIIDLIVTKEEGFCNHEELTQDVYVPFSKKYKKKTDHVRRLVQLFCEQNWLAKDNRNGFCLGPRSFLEVENELFTLGAAKCSKTNQLVVKDRSLWQFAQSFQYAVGDEEGEDGDDGDEGDEGDDD